MWHFIHRLKLQVELYSLIKQGPLLTLKKYIRCHRYWSFPERYREYWLFRYCPRDLYVPHCYVFQEVLFSVNFCNSKYFTLFDVQNGCFCAVDSSLEVCGRSLQQAWTMTSHDENCQVSVYIVPASDRFEKLVSADPSNERYWAWLKS